MVKVVFYDVPKRTIHLKETELNITEEVSLWVIKHWNYSQKEDFDSRLSYLVSKVGKQGGIDWIYKEITPFIEDYSRRTAVHTNDLENIAFQPYLDFPIELKTRMMQWQKKNQVQQSQPAEI